MRLNALSDTPSIPDKKRADFDERDAMPRNHEQTPQLEQPSNRETLEPAHLTNDGNCCCNERGRHREVEAAITAVVVGGRHRDVEAVVTDVGGEGGGQRRSSPMGGGEAVVTAKLVMRR
jgi:hypothetical protein